MILPLCVREHMWDIAHIYIRTLGQIRPVGPHSASRSSWLVGLSVDFNQLTLVRPIGWFRLPTSSPSRGSHLHNKLPLHSCMGGATKPVFSLQAMSFSIDRVFVSMFDPFSSLRIFAKANSFSSLSLVTSDTFSECALYESYKQHSWQGGWHSTCTYVK